MRKCGEAVSAGKIELNSTYLVGLLRRGNVQIGQRNLSRTLLVEDPQGLANNGVVLNLLGVLVAINQLSLVADTRCLPLFAQARHFIVQPVDFRLLLQGLLLRVEIGRVLVVAVGLRWMPIIRSPTSSPPGISVPSTVVAPPGIAAVAVVRVATIRPVMRVVPAVGTRPASRSAAPVVSARRTGRPAGCNRPMPAARQAMGSEAAVSGESAASAPLSPRRR